MAGKFTGDFSGAFCDGLYFSELFTIKMHLFIVFSEIPMSKDDDLYCRVFAHGVVLVVREIFLHIFVNGDH